MTKEYWTFQEVVEVIEIDESFIKDLEKEEIVCPECLDDHPYKRYSAGDLDMLRLAKILVQDMDVNLAGVEVILKMRQNMIHMRRQFDDILEDLAAQIREAFGQRG